MSTILDFYEDEEEFDRQLDDASGNAANNRESEFIRGLRDKFEEYGRRMFLSESQQAWLERIAEDC